MTGEPKWLESAKVGDTLLLVRAGIETAETLTITAVARGWITMQAPQNWVGVWRAAKDDGDVQVNRNDARYYGTAYRDRAHYDAVHPKKREREAIDRAWSMLNRNWPRYGQPQRRMTLAAITQAAELLGISLEETKS